MPANGVNESCIELTLPLEAPVVAHDHIPEFTIPKVVPVAGVKPFRKLMFRLAAGDKVTPPFKLSTP